LTIFSPARHKGCMINLALAAHLFWCLVAWNHAAPTEARRDDLSLIAQDIASTDATFEEAETLVAICKHESECRTKAVGDGGLSRGAFQVRGKDASAKAALSAMRWSMRACKDLSLYAGFGRCGGDPATLASLVDPTLPRR